MHEYCQYCEGPLKDDDNFVVLHDGADDLYFCNEQELKSWLVDNAEKSASIIVDDPELVDVMGW